MTIIYGNKENCNLIFLAYVTGMITNGMRMCGGRAILDCFYWTLPQTLFCPSYGCAALFESCQDQIKEEATASSFYLVRMTGLEPARSRVGT